MTSEMPPPRRNLKAEFSLVTPHILRMVLADAGRGVLDIVERDPEAAGAYAGFLGALDAALVSAPVGITCDFDHNPGRAVARKSRIRAVIASALATRVEEAT